MMIGAKEANERIRSLTPEKKKEIIERFENNIFYSPDGCWYWTAGQNIYKDRGRFVCVYHTWQAPRVSYELFVGPIPDGLHALHSCDNALCVNPNHLFVGTAKDNSDDFYKKQRTKIRRKLPIKVSDSEAEYIKSMRGIKKVKDLMVQFNVTDKTIHYIQSGKRRGKITH